MWRFWGSIQVALSPRDRMSYVNQAIIIAGLPLESNEIASYNTTQKSTKKSYIFIILGGKYQKNSGAICLIPVLI